MVSDYKELEEAMNLDRLNPCCNGIWSQTLLVGAEIEFGLNPCCNGIWSQTD